MSEKVLGNPVGQVKGLQEKLVADEQALERAAEDIQFQREKLRNAMADHDNLCLLVDGLEQE